MASSRMTQGTGRAVTGVALPPAVVAILRHPEPAEGDFTPTKFTPSATKAWFACHCTRFAAAGFPEHHFTERFYRQLMQRFGFIAHYDRAGFWTEYFASTAGTVEFLMQTVSYPCWGSPDHTWSDVEREIIRRLRQADLLGFYRARLGAERDGAERAEFARLKAKYEHDTPPVDPGVLRTVLVTAQRRPPGRGRSGGHDAGQLALGLG